MRNLRKYSLNNTKNNLEIVENELDTKFEEIYNNTQADTVINQKERLVA